MSSNKQSWSEKELNIIKKYYVEFGTRKCSEITGRSRRSCSDMAKKLNINFDRSFKWKKEKLEKVISESSNTSECLKKMDLTVRPGNYETFNKYVELYNINITHFHRNLSGLKKHLTNIKYNIEDILVQYSTYGSSKLKKRLYDEGYKERVCEICGQDENWKDVEISLILDHINGIHTDNRLENLRIVCPNCNAGLSTHCRSSKKRNYIKKRYYCSCGNEISKDANKCRDCYEKAQRKVKNRPSYEQLIKEIEETNYVQVGKKYDVSDNAIRKWVKNYEKE